MQDQAVECRHAKHSHEVCAPYSKVMKLAAFRLHCQVISQGPCCKAEVGLDLFFSAVHTGSICALVTSIVPPIPQTSPRSYCSVASCSFPSAMAEALALAASICGVATYATSVVVTLHETADVMMHAREQIARLAKHVSQFSLVLRQLGKVLENDKDNCSSDMLQQIRSIKRSCKSTFKEINKAIRSRTSRSLVPIRWLFKKAKARELEARLDSQKSTLQVMIHTITVSKLADIQTR